MTTTYTYIAGIRVQFDARSLSHAEAIAADIVDSLDELPVPVVVYLDDVLFIAGENTKAEEGT